MRVYNTMTRKKEELIPLEKGVLKIYACGPTVYNYIHIGNARPICVCDVLRRYLEYTGLTVKFIQNFTDIDDKIINKANEENSDYLTVSKKFIEEYIKDSTGLNIRKATIHPKATENIDEMIDIIKTLVEKGFAYKTENNDVYFRTKNFKDYGKLSHQPLEDLEVGARISVGEIKEDPMDFVVWKSAKPGEPYWDSPWGNGRPGWHIECSAMARRYLGKTIDIHYGGQDLIFPHHENEIAQSECSSGVEFARYWMHNGYINIDNKKMSKSLNNFFTVRDVANKYGYEPIRYLMISSHYRSPINYSEDVIKQCIAALDRLYTCRNNLDFLLKNTNNQTNSIDNSIKEKFLEHKAAFITAMEDDLNTADALSALFDLVRDINSNVNIESSKETINFAIDLFDELSGILGLVYNRKNENVDSKIEDLINQREAARKSKDWALADKIRDELKSQGITLEDTKSGVKAVFHKEP
ncbi:MAG: Cysteine--tRNA ligase [Eubacteriales bacterium SKADARSKE-1]|nr:Cysteine--tRNA ligase [Eubacteriales bacterium SKADARSKE-1]